MTVDGDQKPARDRVFMDISIGGLPSGRLIFELFNDVAPKTTENFRALCAGDMGIGSSTGKPLTYKGMVFHRVVKDFMIQGGDFTNSNGTGGESIYGGTFEDENFELQHDKPFLLSMANRGKDTNGSQFFITTQPAPHLDNVHVVFGNVIGGAALVRQLETLPVDRNARPLQDVTVANCGQLVKLQAGKKRKGKDIKEESGSEAERLLKKDEKKKKKKDKKEKKKKRRQSATMEEDETPEVSSHPLVMTSNIDPKEIPDVPTNRFLMRGGRDQDKNDPRKDRERMRFRERERNSYTRSGRIIKGRGVFRYRTPSRSRSRSRSVTPPHWRMAQRRIIKLSEFERAEQERSELEQQEAAKLASEVHQSRDEGGTPEQPQEKEEGECDSTFERSRHERIDYNALDFEEDVEQDEDTEPPFRTVPERVSRRRERRRDVSPSQSRAEVLARALGVNPNRAKEIIGQHRDTRRGIPSSIQAAPKMPSSVAQTFDYQGQGHGQGLGQGQGLDQGFSSRAGHSDGYDPFSILRSTFRNKEQGQGSAPKNDRPDRFAQERSDRAERQKDTRFDKERQTSDHGKAREGRSRRHSHKDKSKVRKERGRNIDGDKDDNNQDEDQTEKIEQPQKTFPKHIVYEEVTKEKVREGNKDEVNGKSDQDRAVSQDKDKRIDRDKRKDSRDREDREKPRERSRSYEKRRERSRSKGDRKDDRRRDRSKNRDDIKRVDRRRDRSAEKRRDRSRSRNNDRRSRSKSKGQDKRRDRSRSYEKRRDRSRSHEKRRDRSRSFEKRRDRSRSLEKRRDRSKSPEKRRDRSRSKVNDDRKKRSSRSRSRSRSPRKERSKSRNRMPSTSENPERGRGKSPEDQKEEQDDDARKELMEIVRLIKSRQKDRESKAAVKTTEARKHNDLSQSDDSPGEREKRRSTDKDGNSRKRSESPRRTGDHSSSRRRLRSGSRRDDSDRNSSTLR